MPLSKATRTPRRNSCRWCTRNCASWRRKGWRRRSPARRCRRRPWFTRPISGLWVRRKSSAGTAEDIFSRRRPKRCGGFSSIARDPNDEQLIALGKARTPVAREDPDAARLGDLAFYAGLTLKDAAASLG